MDQLLVGVTGGILSGLIVAWFLWANEQRKNRRDRNIQIKELTRLIRFHKVVFFETLRQNKRHRNFEHYAAAAYSWTRQQIETRVRDYCDQLSYKQKTDVLACFTVHHIPAPVHSGILKQNIHSLDGITWLDDRISE